MMEKTLFEGGQYGYHTYRIPALLAIPGGRLLAFCEARLDDAEDYGKIDIVLRVSDDGGRTFTQPRVIASAGRDTIGNPAPVYDRDTGRIWMFLDTNLADGPERLICENKAPRTIGAIHSDDRGESWSAFEDMTETLKRPGWTWYACGPCHALQTRGGRLVIPCNHGEFDEAQGITPNYRPHVILSDDHGTTWRLGGVVDGVCGNETTVEELSDGRLYLNARNMYGRPYRHVAYSDDGGESWYGAHEDANLPDAMCQASVLKYPHAVAGCEQPLLFVNNPFSPNAGSKISCGGARHGLTLKMSLDDGKTWAHQRRLYEGPTAYSDIAVTQDGSIACLYERGVQNPYERIQLAVFPCEWLTNGI